MVNALTFDFFPPDAQRKESAELRPVAHEAGESFSKKILFAVVSFALSGALGTWVTNLIQQRSWNYQNSVARVEKDSDRARAAQTNATELMDGRYLTARKLAQALAGAAADTELKAARAGYLARKAQWDAHYSNLATQIEFDVDAPFGVEIEDKLKAVWPLKCEAFALRPLLHTGAQSTPTRAVIEVINHCHDLLNQELDQATLGRKPFQDYAPLTNVYLEHITRLDETLRCMLVQRALAIQRGGAQVSNMTEMPFGSGEIH